MTNVISWKLLTLIFSWLERQKVSSNKSDAFMKKIYKNRLKEAMETWGVIVAEILFLHIAISYFSWDRSEEDIEKILYGISLVAWKKPIVEYLEERIAQVYKELDN